MGRTLYVSNLARTVTEQELRDYFSNVGEVLSAKIVPEQNTEPTYSAALVEMATDEAAALASGALDHTRLKGRRIRVAEAEARISPVLTVAQLAKYLNVHQTTIYRLIKKRDLPAFHVGADWRFNREHIDRWITEQTKQAKSWAHPGQQTRPKRRDPPP